MLKNVRYFIYLISFVTAVFIYPYNVARATGECAELKAVYRHLLADRKLPITTWRIDTRGRVIITFMDFRTGMWVDVGILPDAKRGCIINEGVDSGVVGARWEL